MSKYRLASLGLSVMAVTWTLHFAFSHARHSDELAGYTVAATEGPSALIRSLRPNYPYSVVAGGVYTPAELAFVHKNDEVVHAHYADFDMAHARLVTLTDDRFQYVSYRIRNQIYWTKNRLRIPKGELLLTDGTHYARTRCGNRLSDTPHESAVNPHEPDRAQLSMPSVTPEMLPKMAMADAPALNGMPEPATVGGPSDSGMARLGEDPAGVPAGASAATQTIPQTGTQEWPPAVTGFSQNPVVPIGPVFPAGGSAVSSSSPNTGANPVAVVNPAGPPTAPAPVPEPNTVGLFLVTLAVSGFALLRMSQKEDSGR